MADRLVELILNVALWTVQGISIAYDIKQKSKAEHESSARNQSGTSLSRFSPTSQYPRAVLVAASSITFGNDCERLVNIAFQTSQTFPTMMGTYADVIEYLHKELIKHYTDECFHIIIGENHGFGFSIDDSQYFAEIAQDQYQILIFSSKKCQNTKTDVHDANSHMIFKWK